MAMNFKNRSRMCALLVAILLYSLPGPGNSMHAGRESQSDFGARDLHLVNSLSSLDKGLHFSFVDKASPKFLGTRQLANGAPSNLRKVDERLIDAISTGREQSVKRLLARGADPSCEDRYGKCALILACFYGYTNIVDDLLAAGADIDLPDARGWTALMEATYYGFTDVVVHLIEAGADVNLEDMAGHNALYYAIYQGFEDIEVILQKAGSDDPHHSATAT